MHTTFLNTYFSFSVEFWYYFGVHRNSPSLTSARTVMTRQKQRLEYMKKYIQTYENENCTL